jgi:hypothetical protein
MTDEAGAWRGEPVGGQSRPAKKAAAQRQQVVVVVALDLSRPLQGGCSRQNNREQEGWQQQERLLQQKPQQCLRKCILRKDGARVSWM